jgi:SAM-dependent methyltransferase
VIGQLYEGSLAGRSRVEIERADGHRRPLDVTEWIGSRPGDDALLARCAGPTLDVGSGPGRLTVELAARGIPALGIDVTPYAVQMTWAAGGLALVRDVFARIPGTGRWATVLLADGNIGIGGEPTALLRRIAELLAPGGRVLVEVEPPGHPNRVERLRLRKVPGEVPEELPGEVRAGGGPSVESDLSGQVGPWFPWAYVNPVGITDRARTAGLRVEATWTEARRWFTELREPY